MDTISFQSRGTRCGAWHLTAEADALTTAGGRPCVVMGHGFGATRDAGLLPFAERFAAAGADVVVFDYRGFGTSEGTPRQDVNHRRHREDYHAVVAAARGLPGVDPDRIVLWGSSYSGGHVIVVAAQDPRIRAVISQGAAMDGLAALFGVQKSGGSGKTRNLTVAGLRDAAHGVLRRAPYLVPIVGEPGTEAVISAPGSVAGYQAIMGPTFRNEMCARGILRIALNRPVRWAGKVRCPVLLVVAEQDNIAPVESVDEVRPPARRPGAGAAFPDRPLRHLRRRGLRDLGRGSGGVLASGLVDGRACTALTCRRACCDSELAGEPEQRGHQPTAPVLVVPAATPHVVGLVTK